MKKLNTILKRTIWSIVFIAAAYTLFTSVNDFRQAEEWLEVFKSIFWMIMSCIALIVSVEHFKKNKYPFED